MASAEREEELKEAKALLGQAKGPRVRQALGALVASLQATEAGTDPEGAVGGGQGSDSLGSTEGGGDVQAPAASAVAAAAAPAGPAPVASVVRPLAPAVRYEPVDSFGWDQGEYNSPWVTVYVTLEGVGGNKDGVSCEFHSTGFDLTAQDVRGKSYRLIQEPLDKAIDPGESKFVVKKNKIIVKLRKVKGEYGYDNWANLVAKKRRPVAGAKSADPSAGIMDLMKDLYEDGDDNMRKIIGESMTKAYANRDGGAGASAPPSLGTPNFDDLDDDLGGPGATDDFKF